MRLTIKIPIQSISDLITNSSSELFSVKLEDKSFQEVKDIVEEICTQNQEYGKDLSSGMGGLLEFKTWEDKYETHKEDWIPANKRDLFTPEIWSINYKESLDTLKNTIWIDIDEGFKSTIDFILKNFFIYQCDCGFFEKDPSTGRLLRQITVEEWNALPKERQYPN
jgi:hypothetical protein